MILKKLPFEVETFITSSSHLFCSSYSFLSIVPILFLLLSSSLKKSSNVKTFTHTSFSIVHSTFVFDGSCLPYPNFFPLPLEKAGWL